MGLMPGKLCDVILIVSLEIAYGVAQNRFECKIMIPNLDDLTFPPTVHIKMRRPVRRVVPGHVHFTRFFNHHETHSERYKLAPNGDEINLDVSVRVEPDDVVFLRHALKSTSARGGRILPLLPFVSSQKGSPISGSGQFLILST